MFQGIQFLVEHGLLDWKADSVAEFLYKEDGLDKTAIGNFLGERYMTYTLIYTEQKHLKVKTLIH